MAQLKRVTTQYDASEDRIRLMGEDEEGRTLCLWLTQRLLNQLVRQLCEGLERPSSPKETASTLRTHVEQSFAQQKARAQLPRQRAVRVSADTPQWRVETVGVRRAPAGVRLSFKGTAEGEQVVLALPVPALRQWLGIVFDQYRRASWPGQMWPAWMEEASSSSASGPQTGVLH